MHIGIDISQVVYQGSGVSRYTEGLINAILRYNSKDHWYFYFSSLRRRLDPRIEEKIKRSGHELRTYPYPPSLLDFANNSLHSFSHMLPTKYKLPHQLDWFITSDWTEPKLPCKKATIVHDLVFKKYPETLHPQIAKTQERRLNIVAQESDLIIAVSQATAQDLKEHYKIPSSQIVVNYTGIEDLSNESLPSAHIIEKYKLHKPFILSVGKLEPRKNIQKLIEAFKKSNTTAQLVIVGAQGWGEQISDEKHQSITFLGYVPDEDLNELYRHALFFIYPSLYEGFGYPILEAMKQFCPVATSNISSLKELGEGHAYLFDPQDTGSITDAINTMFLDEKLRTKLSKSGKEFADTFTWKRYYDKLISELQKRL